MELSWGSFTGMKIKAIIFDVNETLLDMQKLEDEINAGLGNSLGFQIWFSKLLHYSLVENEIGSHHDFSKVAFATLKMAASYFGKEFSEKEIQSLLRLVKELPAYPEVGMVLKALKEDYHLIALTNGNQETAEAQLKYAKIDEYFNGIYSVDVVGKFKPHPSTYKKVLKDYKLKAQEAIMVAAHGWDIAGAQKAGLKTVFVARKGKSLYPLVNTADGLVKDLKGLMETL